MEVSGQTTMADVSTGHGDGLDAVEFVASSLGLRPPEELLLRPGLAKRDVHGEIFYQATRWRSSVLSSWPEQAGVGSSAPDRYMIAGSFCAGENGFALLASGRLAKSPRR